MAVPIVECYGAEADCWPTVSVYDEPHPVMKCRRHGHTWVSEVAA
jgi:hypothetical protein